MLCSTHVAGPDSQAPRSPLPVHSGVDDVDGVHHGAAAALRKANKRHKEEGVCLSGCRAEGEKAPKA